MLQIADTHRQFMAPRKPTDLLTPTDAGRLIGKDVKAIYSAIKRGRLKAHRFGEKTYLLERSAVLEYGRTAKPGRPWPKKKALSRRRRKQ